MPTEGNIALLSPASESDAGPGSADLERANTQQKTVELLELTLKPVVVDKAAAKKAKEAKKSKKAKQEIQPKAEETVQNKAKKSKAADGKPNVSPKKVQEKSNQAIAKTVKSAAVASNGHKQQAAPSDKRGHKQQAAPSDKRS